MRQRCPRGEDGFTLLDVMTGMVVMGIAMVMFTGSIVLAYHSSNRSQAVANTSAQVSDAFTWLDRQVRYAGYVSVPGQVGADDGNWYVELENATTAPATCYQLRIDQDADQLQQRSWTAGGAASAWQPLADDVTNGAAAPGADQPFVLVPVSGSVTSEQLTINLVVSSGGGSSAGGATTHTTVTLPALNTNGQTLAYGTCTGMRP